MKTPNRDRFGVLRARSVLVAILSFVAALLLGGLTMTTAAAQQAPAVTKTDDKLPDTIKVGTEGVYAPFSFHQGGKLTGYDVDYFREVGKRLGVKVEFVETQWDSMFAALDSGRIDVIANQVGANAERRAKYDLTKPYVESHGVVVVRDGSSIKNLADIKGKKSAQNITSDWAGVAKKAGANVVSVDGMDKAVELLSQGRVDTFVNDELAVKYYLATHENSGLKIASRTSDTSQEVFPTKKGSKLSPAINTATDEMNADGTSKKLYAQYFETEAKGTSVTDTIKNNIGPMLVATLKGTIPLTAASFAIGLVLALGVALARMSANAALSWPARIFISIFRGTPLLVQLAIIFFGMPQLGIKLSPWPSAIIAFSLNVAAYSAEIIRAAILSVPKGQWEAAETIGMNRATALRRIILPQALRVAVPPLSNTLISLVKDTSLASTILVTEMFRQAQIAAAPSGDFLELYGVAAAIYWALCFILSLVQGRLENRLGRHVAR